MAEEILNIDYHIKRLTLKALNRFPTTQEAANALGYSARQVLRFKKQFNIKRSRKSKEYYCFEN